ncbi:MAG: hypothetical protein QOH71_1521 [Blastocatellia bacterium]|nr:hypothetical protein [Blastocatellia bacterium]
MERGSDGVRTSCPPAGAARSDSTKRSLWQAVRVAGSGGQDVRAPLPALSRKTLRQRNAFGINSRDQGHTSQTAHPFNSKERILCSY